ncbi:MAG TPA: GNAT family N-acetyltransferase [Polyangiaceae bacterium]|jgi:GNAT superfamily N-acetyltransferase|nr:GNAT family N-acetyltransferase [Polyangiaceae bacterium]
MTEMVIRRAVRNDLPRIVELFGQVDELHRDALPWLFRKLDEPRPLEVLESFITDPDRTALVATDLAGSPPAGVLFIMIRELSKAPIICPARVAEIDTLVVDRSSRRQGIGRGLVRAALHWAHDVRATRTELGVYEFNEEARIFWESMGFASLFRRMCKHDVP